MDLYLFLNILVKVKEQFKKLQKQLIKLPIKSEKILKIHNKKI